MTASMLAMLSEMLNGILHQVLNIYADTFLQPRDLLTHIVLLLLLYTLIQVIITYIPLLNRIIAFIALPGRMVHTHVHVRVARYLSQRQLRKQQEALVNVLWIAREAGIHVPRSALKPRRGIDVEIKWEWEDDHESTKIQVFFRHASFTEIALVAFAPLFVGLFITFVAVLPAQQLMLAATPPHDRFTQAIIHAYASILIFGGLMPSLDDFELVRHASRLLNRPLEVVIALGHVLLTITGVLLIFVATKDLVISLIAGTILILIIKAFFAMLEAILTVALAIIRKQQLNNQVLVITADEMNCHNDMYIIEEPPNDVRGGRRSLRDDNDYYDDYW